MFEIKDFKYEKGEPRTYESSPGVHRSFCGRCGTPLTYTAAEFLPGLVDVTVGSLDEPNALAPQLHVWDSKRLPWLQTSDSLPRHAELPPQP